MEPHIQEKEPQEQIGTEQALFLLLRNGLYADREAEPLPALTDAQWQALLDEADRQTVTGTLYQGLSRLGEACPIPSEVAFRLVAEANRITAESRRKEQVAWDEFQRLKAAGYHPLVLKGPSIARLYPAPALRASGDIDFYLPGDEFSACREQLGAESVPMPDGSLHYIRNGVTFDMHDKYFDLHLGPERLPAVPSPEATLLMLSAHIYKHAAGPGVGLRQICDMAVAYHCLEFNPESLLETYRKAGLLKWNRLLYAFLREYLSLEDVLQGRLEPVSPEPLLRIVREGGNFGHHAASRTQALSDSRFRRKADTARRYLKRLPFSLRYAPNETFRYMLDLVKGNL